MKIYLLIMLIGSPFGRGSLHFGAEAAVGNASAIGFSAKFRPRRADRRRPHGFASGKLPFPARISCTLLLGTPDSSLSIRAGWICVGARPPLVARTKMRFAGASRVAVNRQDLQTAKTVIERRQHLGNPVGAPDQRQRAPGFEDAPRRMNPVRQRRRGRHMRDPARLVRRDAMPRGIVERRIHQHDIDAVRARARRLQRHPHQLRHRARSHRRQVAFASALARARPASAASISTRTRSMPATRLATARPAAPTPAPRSATRSPGRAGVAAASSMAS